MDVGWALDKQTDESTGEADIDGRRSGGQTPELTDGSMRGANKWTSARRRCTG